MAKRKTALRSAPVDIVDLITAKLSETGIPFVRDAWENEAPEEYGVVELKNSPRYAVGDGEVLDEVYTLTVTMYVNGPADTWPVTVREALESLETANGLDIVCHLSDRRYLYDMNRVQWVFALQVLGPLVR